MIPKIRGPSKITHCPSRRAGISEPINSWVVITFIISDCCVMILFKYLVSCAASALCSFISPFFVAPKSGLDQVFCLMARPDLCRVFSEPGPQNEWNKLYTLLHRTAKAAHFFTSPLQFLGVGPRQDLMMFLLLAGVFWACWIPLATLALPLARLSLGSRPPHQRYQEKQIYHLLFILSRSTYLAWRGYGWRIGRFGVIIGQKSFWVGIDNLKIFLQSFF